MSNQINNEVIPPTNSNIVDKQSDPPVGSDHRGVKYQAISQRKPPFLKPSLRRIFNVVVVIGTLALGLLVLNFTISQNNQRVGINLQQISMNLSE